MATYLFSDMSTSVLHRTAVQCPLYNPTAHLLLMSQTKATHFANFSSFIRWSERDDENQDDANWAIKLKRTIPKGQRSWFPDGCEESRADSPREVSLSLSLFFPSCVSLAKFSNSHLPWMEPMMAEWGFRLEGAGKCWRGSMRHMYKSA